MSPPKGTPSPMKGKKHTQEAKEKNREAHIGKPVWNKGLKGEDYKQHFPKGLGGTFQNGHEPWHKGKKVPERSGSNSHLWRGGVTSENKMQRNSLEYKQWRTAVFERDNYTCVWCGETKNLEADHIKPFAFFPDLRFDIENGRTLCEECHQQTPTYKARKVNIESVSNIRPNPLKGLARGIRKCAEVIGSTMGPAGANVLIQESQEPKQRVSNDGAMAISKMVFKDELEQMGYNLVREATNRSNTNSGDGSSTTVVLLNAILQERIKTMVPNDISPMDLKAQLDECLPLIELSIHDQTRQITVADITAVARIAGENEHIAQVLGEIYKTIGKDGIIHLEGSGTYETNFNLIEGVRFVDTGYLSPFMANDGKKARYEKPTILVTKNKIEHFKDIDPILQALIARGDKTLVIFTDDMDSNVARALIELQKNEKRTINILIIKAPVLWKTYIFEDFAKCVGATMIEDASGTSLGNKFRLDWLGTCDTLICDKEETTLIGIKDISDHIKDLEEEGTADAKLRLSWLTTKTAILKLGAKSETELSWLLLKAEDAIFSSRSALKYGVVPGGGVTLRNAAKSLPDTIGGNILKVALEAPIKQICLNANWDIPEQFGEDIIDSAAIVLGAIRNSVGIASTLITISSAIVLPPKSAEELLNQNVMRPAYF